ncbi:hypothetical protein [Brevibacillus laterosporus]|uniref:hypothetical protein n=1 Tax=Brevibacillus laterosporus TaxID=1465 RepID=UPI000839B9CB|nr:hypothetical protein [Brevibacillus laterosporus]
MERNLHEDLEICNVATEGPWAADYHEGHCVEATSIPSWGGGVIVCYGVERADARFIAEARDGWPHAIKRALDAEMKVAQMERRLRAVESTVGRMLDSYGCQDFWDFVMEYESEEVATNDKA